MLRYFGKPQANLAENETEAELSGYDFVNHANYPSKIEISETEEKLGLKPYKQKTSKK
jgi:hypothetical protein